MTHLHSSLVMWNKPVLWLICTIFNGQLTIWIYSFSILLKANAENNLSSYRRLTSFLKTNAIFWMTQMKSTALSFRSERNNFLLTKSRIVWTLLIHSCHTFTEHLQHVRQLSRHWYYSCSSNHPTPTDVRIHTLTSFSWNWTSYDCALL